MPLTSSLYSIYRRLYQHFFPRKYKQHRELLFWKGRKAHEKTLVNDHYAHFYTTHFGLSQNFYTGKRILDLGCGPRGSLEWAHNAAERVGLDPLVPAYRKLGIDRHQMTYVHAPAEKIPFPDAYFDVVCSFNSLDHVDDLMQTIAEIKRVVRPGGLFLLIVEANHPPLVTEPVTFCWDDTRLFEDAFRVERVRKYENGDDIYQQISQDRVFDDANPASRSGVLSALFVRRDAA
jgi:ubiquinone/menaquinone biosynthesis C-methylase UbiE